jgi:wyosine [tRNA(Phe)-imidazoG37] synthetase (radical SAM superfamily)
MPFYRFLTFPFSIFYYLCNNLFVYEKEEMTVTKKKSMSTIIYPSPIFGPVHSRRLGVSLGINLLPGDGKVCTFDCIYCECGFNADHRPHQKMPTRQEVATALEAKLQDMKLHGPTPDVFTFAGNGEPTANPHFPEIIDDTLRLRDRYFPNAKVSVLSNSTMIHRPEVRAALMRIDNNILKLDTIDPIYINKVDRPTGKYDVQEVIENLKLFNGHVIIQTMFMKGLSEGQSVDNTGDEFVTPWLETVKAIAPQQVMIYTIDRETPDHDLLKATHEELDSIRDRVLAAGIPCSASY